MFILTKLFRNTRLLSLVLLGLASVGLVVFVAYSPSSSETTVERAQTNGGVRAELKTVKAVQGGFAVEYNYGSTSNKTVYQLGGASITTSDNSRAGASRGGYVEEDKLSDIVPLQPSGSVKEQPASISLGSFVSFDSSIGGSTSLDFGGSFSSIVGSSQDENSRLSLDQSFLVGDRQYTISELIVDRESPRNNFIIVIIPGNDAAKKSELAMGSSVVTLSDNTPHQYKWIGTRTRWSESEDSIEWQQLSFAGFPSPNANQLTLQIQGVGVVAGPFVFNNITLP